MILAVEDTTRPTIPRTLRGTTQRAERRVHLVQGEFHVASDPDVVLITVLGSCVAACMRDALAGVGGMNHFLLPDDGGQGGGSADQRRYGVHAMELLVNGLLSQGARRDRLEAKLFGGARMLDGLTDIGARNADFAADFLRRERIAFAGGSLRGERGRRVHFWPVSGRARQQLVPDHHDTATVFAAERRQKAIPAEAGGSLELF